MSLSLWNSLVSFCGENCSLFIFLIPIWHPNPLSKLPFPKVQPKFNDISTILYNLNLIHFGQHECRQKALLFVSMCVSSEPNYINEAHSIFDSWENCFPFFSLLFIVTLFCHQKWWLFTEQCFFFFSSVEKIYSDVCHKEKCTAYLIYGCDAAQFFGSFFMRHK